MKRIIILTIVFSGIAFLNSPNELKALTQNVIKQDVVIEINKDSTFEVTESADYVFDGKFHGVRRDITLVDSASLDICEAKGLTCGGFDRVEIISVKRSDGAPVPENQLNFYNTDKGSDSYFRIEWEIYKDGRDVSNYEIGWIIKYKVYGGIQAVNDRPYFYWDLLPEDRGSLTKSSNIKVIFPANVNLNQKRDDLEIFTSLNYNLEFQSRINTTAFVSLKDIPSLGAITMGYTFQKGEIQIPGLLEYEILFPPLGGDITLDNILIKSDALTGKIRGITTGDHILEVSRTGYQTITKEFSIGENENIKYTFNLQQTSLLNFLNIMNTILLLVGICLLPFVIIFIFLHYRNKGRDIKFPKTIVPEFNPPADIRPYLLGSLQNESVDKEDIAGTIIDLAYRGFLKIKKLNDKSYELTDSQKERTDLGEVEIDILDALFNGNKTTTTEEMAKYFPLKYSLITQKIYKELVSKKYFNESPQLTTGKYIGIGSMAIIFGALALFFVSGILTDLFGYFTVFTLGLDLLVLGIGFLIISRFMPAKTEIGSKAYADILGFKMYLNTAERYRLQKLEPEEFEKYLSYAIVFGIEKEWADKFKGLYNKVPDWYEGDMSGIYNAYFISSFARSFTAATVTSFAVPPSSSGSGWSGGGGGGFSGGGGGGGSSGGW